MSKRKKIDVDTLRAWSYTAEQKEIGEARKLLDTAIKARFPVERKRKEKLPLPPPVREKVAQ